MNDSKYEVWLERPLGFFASFWKLDQRGLRDFLLIFIYLFIEFQPIASTFVIFTLYYQIKTPINFLFV